MIRNRPAPGTPSSAGRRLDFRPLPFLGNPHVQTLLGHLLTGRRQFSATREHTVRLPDGDALVLHDSEPAGWQGDQPIVVLVHGLTGSHASSLLVRVGSVLFDAGRRVVRVDLRGAGKSLTLSRRAYHGGHSEDVRLAVEAVRALAPQAPITLVGVSLGGNIVLKLAGEAADRPVEGLCRVAALAPPIDLGRCVAMLRERRNRIYEKNFLRELVADARKRQEYFPDLEPLTLPESLTIHQFDDLYTAPRGGFQSGQDYYRRSSALPLMGRIQLPTFVMTARDDPFIAVEPFEEVKASSSVEVHIMRHGGHLGFLGWDGAGGIRWAERRLVDWVLER